MNSSFSHSMVLAAATELANQAPLVLLGVILSLVVIYVASKLGAELSNRLGFPPVLGELVGGVVVGISVFHLIVFPEGDVDGTRSLIMQFLQLTNGLSSESINPVFEATSEVIAVLSELGVIVLLFEIGLESNLNELLKVGPQALVVATVGVALPFIAGTMGAIALFQVPVIPAIFVGAALTATSIGITSKVLSELGQLGSQEGQIILGAAIADDILGIVILAVVASLAKKGEIEISSIVYLVVSAVVFTLVAIVFSKYFNTAFLAIANLFSTRGGLIMTAVVFALVMAYIGAAIHLEAILGAFAAGLVLEETEKREHLEELIKPIADVTVPIFFVTVGAKTNLAVLNPFIESNREGLIIAIFLITVAILGKVATGLAVFGNEKINRLAIGVGMIPRGEVGLVFAGVGAASGILSDALNAAIVMMVIITTFLAPPLLRVVFPPPVPSELLGGIDS
jgi:Kef-type K+ transport system membrane component KefB